MRENKQIDFYCKKCGKSMKMTYSISGDNDAPVLPGMIIRCHINKCTRVMILKKYTEGMVIAQADKEGKVFI
ncbi:hypothetical protein [Enterocloster bolteae]|jgi:hypothetical protein|uniref:hypothetical protein n=1 Tax=Enterocloster bolteae TaxID=208479 RepID=UPI002108820C|nr:hypothetical protein [Enterocloster bolteae]MCQ4754630.1 hypothetical protein [Enterocloster bolteae]